MNFSGFHCDYIYSALLEKLQDTFKALFLKEKKK